MIYSAEVLYPESRKKKRGDLWSWPSMLYTKLFCAGRSTVACGGASGAECIGSPERSQESSLFSLRGRLEDGESWRPEA